MLQSMGLQRVGHDSVTELSFSKKLIKTNKQIIVAQTELKNYKKQISTMKHSSSHGHDKTTMSVQGTPATSSSLTIS